MEYWHPWCDLPMTNSRIEVMRASNGAVRVGVWLGYGFELYPDMEITPVADCPVVWRGWHVYEYRLREDKRWRTFGDDPP